MVNFTVPHSRVRRSTLAFVHRGTYDNRTFLFTCRTPIFLYPTPHLLLPKFSRERERHVNGECDVEQHQVRRRRPLPHKVS